MSRGLPPPNCLFAFLLSLPVIASPAGGDMPDCLYATSVGAERIAVEPCSGDVRKLGGKQEIQAVMKLFRISDSAVSFRSCPGGRFSALPDFGKPGRYVVRYPSSVGDDYLAPLIHEIAHVYQMQSAGGLAALDPENNSLRIELGADFLTGLAFNMVLDGVGSLEFEGSLYILGDYTPRKDDHGCPECRSAAFLTGKTRYGELAAMNVPQSLRYFYRSLYGRISRK